VEARTDGPDLRHDQLFVGRERELTRLLRNITEGRHTLLAGQYGIGKSSLMREARALLTGARHRVDIHAGAVPVRRDRILTVTSPVPLGDCLREMAGGLYRNGDFAVEAGDGREDWGALKKRFTSLGMRGMQSEVLKNIAGSGKTYIVFVTNLDRVTLTSLSFFESLLRITVVCGSTMATKDTEAFRGFWASFERIRLDRLSAGEARELITALMGRYPLNVIDPQMCRNGILSAADGNPFHIKNLLYRAATQKVLGSSEIREFRAAEEGPFFNMGPLYMIAAGVLTAVKFFSVGAEKREHYIYYSAIGFMLYLTFRVFRGFFVFRPQRRK
jgi:hypothetical protein